MLLFGSETWVLSAAMDRMAEGTRIVFLVQIMVKRARRKADRTWYIPEAEEVREAAETKHATTYTGRRQGTVAQWVALRPIFEV